MATSVTHAEGITRCPPPQILDALGAGILVVDRRGRIEYRNRLATQWLPDGKDLNEAFTCARFEKPIADWPAEIDAILKTGQTRRFSAVVQTNQAPRARAVIVQATANLDHGSNEHDRVVLLLIQENDSENTDKALEVSARLASLGKLAARVAHELSNPLDGILRYTNLAMRLVNDTPESKLKSYLSESRTGLMRMVQIIGDLLEYSRSTDGAFDAVSINEVVEEAMRAVADAAHANGVIVSADFQTQHMPSITGSRLYQVCCNLMKNAVDALPDGGRISITVGLVDQNVVIRIADTGSGLPEPIDRVFEPFFTTKPPGQGTGLGLAICKDFVEGLKGTITAESGKPGGAVFTVRIPQTSCVSPAPVCETSRRNPL